MGLKIIRKFVPATQNAENQLKWKTFDTPQGPVEAPDSWSPVAVDIAARQYLRKTGVPGTGRETSIRQLVDRVAQAIATFAPDYFASAEDQTNFLEELKYILLTQRGAFNSPVWFNCGLFQSYKITAGAGGFYFDPVQKKVMPSSSAYEYPQSSACFIQSAHDDLMSIFELIKNEAKLFKYGSGTGSNFSNLRSKYEKLEGGGTSSGLLSFLDVFDKAALVTKSGGTTRRAAKMVCLDADHPEILEFIEWKVHEEKKAQALIKAGYEGGFEGEAYRSVSGQNSNNSVRVTDEFLDKVKNKKPWDLISRTDGSVLKTIEAEKIWNEMAEAAWMCADPGVQYHTTIQQWHTCSASGDIRASNPCSEYMFLDDSACNLASVNLVKFLNSDDSLDLEALAHAARILFIAQDLLVELSSYPTEKIAQNSHSFRPLGFGFTNLAALFMRQTMGYESRAARNLAESLMCYLQGVTALVSIELAEHKGSFKEYPVNKQSMMRVMKQHADLVSETEKQCALPGVSLQQIWQSVLKRGEQFGFRNSQLTAIAPTGTISLFMDCDTTGIEPDFALVKRKTLAGGGHIILTNQSVAPALQKLGYDAKTDVMTLKAEHQSVFKTAHEISARDHLEMVAAVQKYVSGAISKTINLPANATAADIKSLYWLGWERGLKSLAVYRDGSKGAQPLEDCRVCG